MDRDQVDAGIRALEEELKKWQTQKATADDLVTRCIEKQSKISHQYHTACRVSTRCGLNINHVEKKLGALRDRSEALHFV